MTLAEPAWLFGLALVPLLWWLEQRWPAWPRREVAGLFLWREAERRSDALVVARRRRAPWRWLRRAALFAAVFVALAGPARRGGEPTVVVVDLSASMAAREAGSSRLDEARALLGVELGGGASADPISVVAAGAQPEIVARWGTREAALRALAALVARPGPADLRAAVDLARTAAREQAGARILVVSDSAELARLPADVAWRRVGRSVGNLGIVACSLRAPALAIDERQVFVELLNAGTSERRASLEIESSGVLVWRTDLALAPGERRAICSPVLPEAAAGIAVRLRGASAERDALSLDDVAYAVAESGERPRVLWVSDGRPFVSTALALHPGLALTRLSVAEYRTRPRLPEHEVRVLDGALPAREERGAILRFSASPAPRGSAVELVRGAWPVLLAREAGGAQSPLFVSGVESLVRQPGDRELLSGSAGALVVARERSGRREIEVGFDPEGSDFARRAELPILLHRAIAWLAGADEEPPAPRALAGEAWSWRVGESSAAGVESGERTSARVEPPLGPALALPVVSGAVTVPSPVTAGIWRVRFGERARAFAVSVLDADETELAVDDTLPRTREAVVEAASGRAGAARSLAPWLWLLALTLLAADGVCRRTAS